MTLEFEHPSFIVRPDGASILGGANSTYMLKRENDVKWSPKTQDSFTRIKEALSEAPVLVNPDCLMPLCIFSFSSLHTIVAVLL